MNGWKLFLVIGAVVVAHVAGFAWLSERQVLPDRPYIAPPNFSARETTVVDERTGERYVHREITVSTRLKDLGPSSEAGPSPTFTP